MREMTGTDILNRRANDILCHYDNPKLVKSRSNLELTAHSRPHHHRADKGHDRHGYSGHRSHEKPTSRKHSRGGQSGSDSQPKTTRSRTKDSLNAANDNPDVHRSSASGSILPPISGHQISNPHVKSGALSPRAADSAVPTRMAIRNSNSPENVIGKPHENHQSHSSLERNSYSQTPPITIRNASTINNVIGISRTVHVTSPESPRAQESSRLSPINTHDRPKVKFEKKVMKLLVDDSVPSSPRAYKISSAELGNQPPPSRDSQTKQRRQSIKSLPKIAQTDEPFSVRRKIEQFRKWHEEHYADALKPSPEENESPDATHRRDGTTAGAKATDDVDFTKILEDNIVHNRLATAEGEETAEVGIDGNKQDINGNVMKSKNSSSRVTKGFKSNVRPKSGATWKTWRDVNQSDAYDDVKKYIKDNDLMDEDREKWIQTWISDVQKAMEDSEEIFVDE